MSAVYLIDDNPIYLDSMSEAIRKKMRGLKVQSFGNDVDFLVKIKGDYEKSSDPSQIFAVLDIELNKITYHGWWAEIDAEEYVKTASKFGPVEFPSHALHGFNIYRQVRGLSKDIKIAIVTSYTEEEMIRLRGNKKLPEDPNLIYIFRNDTANVLVDQLKIFFSR